MSDEFENAVVQDTSAVVFDLAVQQPSLLPVMQVTSIPILCLEVKGNIMFPEETFHWARSRLQTVPLKRLRREMNVLARLYRFWARYPDFCFEVRSDVDLLIWNYLFLRLHSPSDISKRPFPTWNPITLNVAREEFRTIARFARYCYKQHRNGSPLGLAFGEASHVFETGARKRPDDDFFKHLSIQKDNWDKIIGYDPVFPRELTQVKGSKVRTSQLKLKTPTVGEVEAIISNEGNYLFRALFLLLFGTGIRISEGLNLWTCDVLPSSYSPVFTGHANCGEPVIILAHPEHCTYTHSIEDSYRSYTRTDELASLGLRPRTGYHTGLQAGAKSILYSDHTRQLSWAFWNNMTYAREFDRLVGEILRLHRAAPNSERGPFFFCNSAPYTEFHGAPLRYNNAARAFRLACKRVGLKGYSLHSARHYYKWFCQKELGLSDSEIQIFMHHMSIKSQQAYGRREEAAYEMLQASMGGKNVNLF